MYSSFLTCIIERCCTRMGYNSWRTRAESIDMWIAERRVYTCSWQVHQIDGRVTSGTLIINVNAAIRCVAFARYSWAIPTRSLLRHYRCSFDLQFNAFSRQPAHKIVWDFTGILFCRVAIRITNQVLSILDEAIDASPQPILRLSSFRLILILSWKLNVPWFTFERGSSKSVCSGASAPLMILNILLAFMKDYTGPLLRFIWEISCYQGIMMIRNMMISSCRLRMVLLCWIL